MIEHRVFGREVTVGIIGESALGIVEVIPTGGVYDYERKYSAGSTEYRYPAVLTCEIETSLREFALTAFDACRCGISPGRFYHLRRRQRSFWEVNTLPGLTATSLLPKSASCAGYDFDRLTARLVEPAFQRFSQRSLLSA